MDQFEQMIKMSSVNELHKKLKDIIYHACNLGKNIPTIENKDEQDMFLKEYLSSIDSISQIKEPIIEQPNIEQTTQPSIDNFQYSDETDVLRATDLVGFMNTPQPVVETADSRLETSSRKNTSRSDYNFTQDLSDFGIEDIDNN